MREYFHSSAPPRPEAVVIELTAATGLELTFRGMLTVVNTLARGLSLLMSRLRFVIIAPDSLSFGMARQFQQLAARVPWFEVSILPSIEEAASLLDLGVKDLTDF